MDKNPLGDGRMIPMDDAGLQAMLSSGPGSHESDVAGEIPPMPQPEPTVAPEVKPEAAAPALEPSASDPPPKAPLVDEGPNEDMKSQMILPSEEEKAILKAKYGMLRVVPIPYARSDGKVQTYILRQLTRSQWRTMEDASRKIAESKPAMSAEEIFQEKIVAQATVWPNLQEHQIAASPPGLVPTLFGIVQQMGLFFNPEAIMSVTFIFQQMDLAALKRKHRFLFCTELAGRLIYWRPLTLREHDIYHKIIAIGIVPIGKLQDKIFREIVLDPSLIDAMNQTPPGLVASIVNTALSVSGNLLRDESDMDRLNNDLISMRNEVSNNPYEQFILLICKAFPTYTPSDIECLEYQEVLRLLVMAEQMIGIEEPIKLTRKEEKKSLTDSLFQDRKQAEQLDMGRPSAVDIRDVLTERQKPDLATQQARQIEMMNKMRERNARQFFSPFHSILSIPWLIQENNSITLPKNKL